MAAAVVVVGGAGDVAKAIEMLAVAVEIAAVTDAGGAEPAAVVIAAL